LNRAAAATMAGCVAVAAFTFVVVDQQAEAAGAADGATSTTSAASTSPAITRLYAGACATCHGPTGAGTRRGPSLMRVGAADADYELSTGRMPLADPDATPQRHRPAYSPATVRALVRVVAGFGPGPAIPHVRTTGTDVATGGTLYRLNCAACHQSAGGGGALVEREAPDLTHATPTQVAEAVRVGPGQMPSFGRAALSDTELADVAAYVQQLRHPNDAGGLPIWHLGPVPEGGIAIVVGLGLAVLATMWIGNREPRESS
jgi:ubiquinol-cytochrome c reductase cytochrome c subunit